MASATSRQMTSPVASTSVMINEADTSTVSTLKRCATSEISEPMVFEDHGRLQPRVLEINQGS